jgi:hypothetical protein
LAARHKKGEARRLAAAAGWAGPLRGRFADFGPIKNSRRDWAKGRGEKPGLQAKTVKENISISFSFPNISNTFSNDF